MRSSIQSRRSSIPSGSWGKWIPRLLTRLTPSSVSADEFAQGEGFAEGNVWLLMANVAATMNIEKSVDEMGRPITPNS
jgi:hypothetical protein